MTDRVIRVLDAAKEFSLEERAELAEKLLDTLDETVTKDDQADIDASWAVEIERRIDAFHAGEIEAVPGEEVMKRLFAKYKR